MNGELRSQVQMRADPAKMGAAFATLRRRKAVGHLLCTCRKFGSLLVAARRRRPRAVACAGGMCVATSRVGARGPSVSGGGANHKAIKVLVNGSGGR